MANRRTSIVFQAFNRYEVRVIVSGNVRATCRRLRNDPGPCVACFLHEQDSKVSWLVLPTDVDEGTIAHESSHAISELLRWAGAKRDEETFAYHLDYLVTRIHKFMKKGKTE